MIETGGAVNGGSLLPGIASGTWIAIKGRNLSLTTRSSGPSDITDNQLPTQLDGVSVTVNGILAYIKDISPSQIDVIAPDDLASGLVPVQVTTPNGTSNMAIVFKMPFAPGFFQLTPQYAAAVHADGTYVGKRDLIDGTDTSPTKPGETILLSGTGFGPTDPLSASGQIVGQALPLSNTVTILIGGKQANVSSASLSSPGQYQFRVTVPPDLADGDQPLIAEVGGAQTEQALFLTVQK